MSSGGSVYPARFFENERDSYWITKENRNSLVDVRTEIQEILKTTMNEIESKAPKELIREYEIAEKGKLREVGPLVYGFSAIIGSDNIPIVREFGNIGLPDRNLSGIKTSEAKVQAEREPLVDMAVSDKEVRVIIEMPGVSKRDIKINSYEGTIKIIAGQGARKYKSLIKLPVTSKTEVKKCTFIDGLLEITFDKKKEPIIEGKQIKIE